MTVQELCSSLYTSAVFPILFPLPPMATIFLWKTTAAGPHLFLCISFTISQQFVTGSYLSADFSSTLLLFLPPITYNLFPYPMTAGCTLDHYSLVTSHYIYKDLPWNLHVRQPLPLPSLCVQHFCSRKCSPRVISSATHIDTAVESSHSWQMARDVHGGHKLP